MTPRPGAAPPGAAPTPLAATAAADDRRTTLRGCGLMVVAMACFALEDALIKTLQGAIPAAQILWVLGGGGALILAAWLRLRGRPLWLPGLKRPRVMLRTLADGLGGAMFVPALLLAPLATVSAVIQATPLVVAMGAAVFLGMRVGPRRWAAILVGFAGVLLILRPGSDSFDPYVLLAVGGMLMLSVRDLATKGLPPELSGVHLSMLAFGAFVPAGIALHLALGVAPVLPTPVEAATLATCLVIGLGGYVVIVAATREGDIAVISSFRYSRMMFALVLAMALFGERPDRWTLIGVGIVIAAGLYTLIREARLRASP